MKTLLRLAVTLSSPLVAVPLLGISVDVTLRLKNVKDDQLKHISSEIKVWGTAPRLSNAFSCFLE